MIARRIADVGLTGLVVAAMIALHHTTPGTNEFEQPVAVRGDVGDEIRTPLFTLRIERIRIGKQLDVPKYKDHLTTGTSFVVVDAVATATKRPILLGTVRIRTGDDVLYDAPRRAGYEFAELGSTELSPGIAVRGSFVVEMPADRLPGARLEVVEASLETRFEPQATVPLDLDAGRVEQLTEDVVKVEKATDS